MPRMYKTDSGYHNFRDGEVEEAVKDGWKVVTEEEWAVILKAKSVAPVEEPDTIVEHDAPKRRGRTSKKAPLPSFFGVDDGNGTDDN